MATKKLALQGLSNISMAPLVKNTLSEYEVGDFFNIPYARNMKRAANVDEKTIYADDDIYMTAKSDKGMKIEIELAEVSLDLLAKLGAGEMDADTGEYSPYAVAQGREYALSFASRQEEGEYRMYALHCVEVVSIEENDLKTKGDGTDIYPYKLVLLRKTRKNDGAVGVVKDGGTADLSWLNSAR